ncbi:MAG: copper homeostasis protein CutC [Candidatus Azobacteroides sp.]|nr:copper homeostasis protein CutC [Candidatus Azobacteroides sp.]
MEKNKRILEVCVDSVCNALTAQSAGAHRIEFCADLPEGGTTPSPAQIEIAQKQLHIQLYVIIRPRGGDFLYNETEFEIMKSDIHFCGKTGCDGVVIGMLHPDGTVDKERNDELIQIAHRYAMGVTFHRAFDRCADLFQAMETIIELGCERILTSGGYDTAIEGAEVIRKLIEKAGERIIIMPGSGITPENADDLIQKTGANELHGTFRSRFPSRMQYRNEKLSRPDEEYGLLLTDTEKIKSLVTTIFRSKT